MTLIKDVLEEQVAGWERLAFPDLLHRFILRNGRSYRASATKVKLGEPKECFTNAAKHLLEHRNGTYCEGVTLGSKFTFLFHHAWIVDFKGEVLDPTLADNTGHQYFGVEFTRREMLHELMRNGHYGLLDSGLGLNTRLMFGIDPKLKAICKEIASRKSLLNRSTP
jgi:hypothetical protein